MVSGLSQKTLQEDFAPLSDRTRLGEKQVHLSQVHLSQISQVHLSQISQVHLSQISQVHLSQLPQVLLSQISQVLLSQIEDDLAQSRCTEVTKL